MVFQLAGQIQILDQDFDFQTLLPDDSGLLSRLLRQGRVIFQAVRIAHHHGQRRPDVVGYAGDPLRSRRIPPVQVLPLNFQNAGYLIQLFGQIPGDAVFRNRDPSPVHQPVQPEGDGTQPVIQPIAGQESKDEDHKKICAKNRKDKKGEGFYGAWGIFYRIFCDASFGVGHHKKAQVTVPDLHRIVQQIPAAEGSYLSHGITLLNSLRQVPAPDPCPVVI